VDPPLFGSVLARTDASGFAFRQNLAKGSLFSDELRVVPPCFRFSAFVFDGIVINN